MDEKIKYEIKNVAKFFAGRSIFITGGTGFIGKVLIEKLLRSCPEIDKLYLLIREKKNIPIEERIKKIFSLELFAKLNEINPSAYKKVIPIFGDVSKKDLGLHPADRQLIIDNVSIIIHNAANVSFSNSLRSAIFNNTRSTRDLCILAESVKKLAVFLYVSSTYAHCDIPVVDEIPYKAEVDWKEVIKIAENMDEYLLKILTAKFIGTSPNTYIFSKKLAEDVINYYSDRLPCVICRPSIVINTIDDPFPGWVDNYNGPMGLMIAAGVGLVRSTYMNPNKKMDYIPIDYVIKIFILAIYLRGHTTLEQYPTVMVYNIAMNKILNVTMNYMIDLGKNMNFQYPMKNTLWYPNVTPRSRFLNFYIFFILYQLLPCVIADQFLKLIGHKPILVKLQRRIYLASVFLFFFNNNEWDFINKKMIQLIDSVSYEDRADFSLDISNACIDNIILSGVIGSKKYFMKDYSDCEKNKRAVKRLFYYYIITIIAWYTFCLWFVLRMLNWI